MIIIGLLGNAISQFKIYRCPRMRRLLGIIIFFFTCIIEKRFFLLLLFFFFPTVVQMAEEYFNCKDYGKVLT